MVVAGYLVWSKEKDASLRKLWQAGTWTMLIMP